MIVESHSSEVLRTSKSELWIYIGIYSIYSYYEFHRLRNEIEMLERWYKMIRNDGLNDESNDLKWWFEQQQQKSSKCFLMCFSNDFKFYMNLIESIRDC